MILSVKDIITMENEKVVETARKKGWFMEKHCNDNNYAIVARDFLLLINGHIVSSSHPDYCLMYDSKGHGYSVKKD